MKSGKYTQLESKEPLLQQSEVIIPAPDKSIEKEHDIYELTASIVQHDRGRLSRIFNHAQPGEKIVKFILNCPNLFPKRDFTRQQADNIMTDLALHEMENHLNDPKSSSILDDSHHFQAWIKNALPDAIQKPLAHIIPQLYSLTYQAICNAQGDFQPWLVEYLGDNLVHATEQFSKETLRDYFIGGAMQCIGSIFIYPPNQQEYPFFGATVGKLISLQNKALTECRNAINTFKKDFQGKNKNSLIYAAANYTLEQTELSLSNVLKESCQLSNLPYITKAMEQASEILRHPSEATILALEKFALEAPGHKEPLRLASGSFVFLGGVTAIGLSIAAMPFTGGLSLPSALSGSLLSYLIGSAGTVGGTALTLGGASLIKSGQQKGYSQTLSLFAEQSKLAYNFSHLVGEKQPLLRLLGS